MKLTESNLKELCRIATKAAKEAGAFIGESVDKNIVVQHKKAAESVASQVVTEVDFKSQEIILNHLAPTLSLFDLALLTEESTDDKSRFEKDYFWCIDPMDGTLAFTEQTPGFSVSIALVSKKGEPQIGVIFDPHTKTLFHAIKGNGAYKNEQIWLPDLSIKNRNTFNLYLDRSFLSMPNSTIIISEIENKVSEIGLTQMNIEIGAGAVLNAIWVMDKAPGCYFKIPKPQKGGGSLWDFAATSCIANEAGIYAKSFNGTPLDLNRADSSFMNHKGVLYSSSEEIAKIIQQIKTD